MNLISRQNSKIEHFHMDCSTDKYEEHFVLYFDDGSRWIQHMPIGTSMGNFIDATDDVIDKAFRRIQMNYDWIKKAEDEKELSVAIKSIQAVQRGIWKYCPLLAPLIVECNEMITSASGSTSFDIKKFKGLRRDYVSLQRDVSAIISKCMDVKKAAHMKVRYYDLQKKGESGFKPLIFGPVELGEMSFDDNDTIGVYRDNVIDPDGNLMQMDTINIRGGVTEILHTSNMEELANFLIYSYLDMDLRMQKCKYCGRYFGVADNYRSEYCNRLIKNSTKTCKELGSVKLYEQKLMENPAVREYKRSYKSHNSRVRYGSMTKEEFSAWSKAARKMRDKCIAGEITLEEFKAWLDSDRRR